MSGFLLNSFVHLSSAPAVGDAIFTTTGTFTWVAPIGVTSVSAVAVGGGGGGVGYSTYSTGGGGGGLGWKNNISVTPGTSYTVVVGSGGAHTAGIAGINAPSGNQSYFINSSTVRGAGGQGGWQGSGLSGGSGGTFVGDGGGNGGQGGRGSSYAGGGGGAGGYSGDGGSGNTGTALYASGNSGSGGGGGGGGSGGSADTAGSGGGVGLFGQGSNGSYGGGTTTDANGGGGGSGGSSAGFATTSTSAVNQYSNDLLPSSPGRYGGGGAATDNTTYTEITGGAAGGVRIMYGGGRSFPSNAGLVNGVSYRYFRIVITDWQNSGTYAYTGIAEFELWDFTTSGSGVKRTISSASASSQYSASYSASYAIDGIIQNYNSGWYSSNGGDSTPTLTLDLGSAQTVTTYRIYGNNDSSVDISPRTWTFEGSNDGTNWVTLDTKANLGTYRRINSRNQFMEFLVNS